MIIRLFRCIKAVALGFMASLCGGLYFIYFFPVDVFFFFKGEREVMAARHRCVFLLFNPIRARKTKKQRNTNTRISFSGEDTMNENAVFTVVVVKCHKCVFLIANLFKVKLRRSA